MSALPRARSLQPEALAVLVAIATGLHLTACAATPQNPAGNDETGDPVAPVEVYRRAHDDQTQALEREAERLRADLRQAEEAMVAIESGLLDAHTRADAVSALAEARISVERAGRKAPWRPARALEAHRKLEEAERQLQAGRTGSAVFFASRARRIAEDLSREAGSVSDAPASRFVAPERLNLRAGPSTEHAVLEVLQRNTPVFEERLTGPWALVRTIEGRVGWVHAGLLRRGR